MKVLLKRARYWIMQRAFYDSNSFLGFGRRWQRKGPKKRFKVKKNIDGCENNSDSENRMSYGGNENLDRTSMTSVFK